MAAVGKRSLNHKHTPKEMVHSDDESDSSETENYRRGPVDDGELPEFVAMHGYEPKKDSVPGFGDEIIWGEGFPEMIREKTAIAL